LTSRPKTSFRAIRSSRASIVLDLFPCPLAAMAREVKEVMGIYGLRDYSDIVTCATFPSDDARLLVGPAAPSRGRVLGVVLIAPLQPESQRRPSARRSQGRAAERTPLQGAGSTGTRALREHGDVARLLTSVDRHAPEAVPVDLGPRLDRGARASQRHEREPRAWGIGVAPSLSAPA
jgi:hypothetical protein